MNKSRNKIKIIFIGLLVSCFFAMQANSLLAEESASSTDAQTVSEPAASEPAVNPEDQVNTQLIDDLNKQIDTQRDKIEELTKKIDEYKQNIKGARNESINLQNQVYILENQIAKTSVDIKLKEEEVKKMQLEIEKIILEIKRNEAITAKEKVQLGNFIRLLHRYDEKGYISVLLSNSTFSEFFDQIKYSQDIQKNLQTSLNRIQEVIEKLTSQQKDLNTKKDELSKLLNKLDESKGILTGQKDEKNYLITETKKSEKKFQIMVEDLKKEQAAANAAITGMERKIRAELSKKGKDEKLNTLANAALVWPTNSQRLTATFHDPDYPYRYLFEHSGIDVGVGSGTNVGAAEAGYVAKVGIGTKWYGNYIMIIHSNNLSTLYAHLSSVSVNADEYVARGQSIGLSGSTGFSSGPHLHFEVRSNGIPVNPLSYLP